MIIKNNRAPARFSPGSSATRLTGTRPRGRRRSSLSACSRDQTFFFHPLKPPSSLLFLAMAHFRLASIGFISSFNSCPYRHSPASSLKVSLAPKPIGLTLFSTKFLINFSTWVFNTDISKPSSPV